MSHQEEAAFLMTSEIEDDLVVSEDIEVEEPTHSNPSGFSQHQVSGVDIDTEMDRILNTPWYELTQDQAEIIHRLVTTSAEQQNHDVLRDSIEHSLIELAMVRGRNEVSQQHFRITTPLRQQQTPPVYCITSVTSLKPTLALRSPPATCKIAPPNVCLSMEINC